MASAAQMSPADARAAIFNATVEMLKLNEKVGNSLPAEIVQCVDGKAVVNTDSQVITMGQSPAGRTTVTTETATGVSPSTIITTEGTSTSQGGGARRTRRRSQRKAHRKTHIRRHK